MSTHMFFTIILSIKFPPVVVDCTRVNVTCPPATPLNAPNVIDIYSLLGGDGGDGPEAEGPPCGVPM